MNLQFLYFFATVLHVRCCVPLADCGCAPPVFIRHRYDACAYFLQSFEFWHSFKRFLLPFFVCCMFGFFTTLRPSLTWFERIRQLIYTNLVQFCYFNIKTLSLCVGLSRVYVCVRLVACPCMRVRACLTPVCALACPLYVYVSLKWEFCCFTVGSCKNCV